MYTGQHVPHTQVHDNDNMPWVRPLDPALGTLGTMLSAAGYYCTYQDKWHLANAATLPNRDPPPGTSSATASTSGMTSSPLLGDSRASSPNRTRLIP